jgi:hypothetical protein
LQAPSVSDASSGASIRAKASADVTADVFPGGQLQALGVAWDSRPKEQGGQRWFALYPDQKRKPGDPLRWTGRDQTWNYQCADCHSTDLKKNYDLAANTYATSRRRKASSIRCSPGRLPVQGSVS